MLTATPYGCYCAAAEGPAIADCASGLRNSGNDGMRPRTSLCVVGRCISATTHNVDCQGKTSHVKQCQPMYPLYRGCQPHGGYPKQLLPHLVSATGSDVNAGSDSGSSSFHGRSGSSSAPTTPRRRQSSRRRGQGYIAFALRCWPKNRFSTAGPQR